MFQSTHPHGVRPNYALTTLPADIRFNPRTHMGCDGSAESLLSFRKVSIHAPTWGATKIETSIKDKQNVSIHAPTWGATLLTIFLFHSVQCFNPRTHMGCDMESRVRQQYMLVSIHAPTWGATHLHQLPNQSNPFQSTHPHGVRPIEIK